MQQQTFSQGNFKSTPINRLTCIVQCSMIRKKPLHVTYRFLLTFFHVFKCNLVKLYKSATHKSLKVVLLTFFSKKLCKMKFDFFHVYFILFFRNCRLPYTIVNLKEYLLADVPV